MGCVYVICCEKTQQRYVGQTIAEEEPHRRVARHIRDAMRGSPYIFHAAIREHLPSAFFVEKIFKSSSEHVLNRVEALWADIYNAYCWSTDAHADFPAGYNSAPAGFSNKFRGKKHSAESRAKISAARKKYWAQKSVSSSDESNNQDSYSILQEVGDTL